MNNAQMLAQRVVNSQNEKRKHFNKKLTRIVVNYINDMMSFEHLFEKSADRGRPLTYRVLPPLYYKDINSGEYIYGKFEIPKELKEDLTKKGYKVSIIRWGHSKKIDPLYSYMCLYGFTGHIVAIVWGPGKQVGKFLKNNIYTCSNECNVDTIFKKLQPDLNIFRRFLEIENITEKQRLKAEIKNIEKSKEDVKNLEVNETGKSFFQTFLNNLRKLFT